MSHPSPSADSQRVALERALAPVKLRVRAVRALRALVLFVMFGAALVVIASAAHALGMLDALDRSHALLGGVFIAVWGLALGWSRAPSTMDAAQLVDRSHATSGRIAAAVALIEEGASGPMAALAIDDAVAHAQRIEAARTLAFTAPRFLRPAMLAALVAAIASLLGPPSSEVAASTPITRRLRPIALHDDDLASLREHMTSLPERHRSPEVRAEIDALNTLLEELSGHEVERAEALRRLGEIADGLREARPGALDATLEALAPMARPLSRSPLTESIGEALRDGDLATAARELERLSERVEREPPSPAELERLREAMAAAASDMDTESLRREREALEEQRDRLLHRDEEESAMSESERTSRDERRERELERLRRDIEERTERERELEELRRELAEALDERNPESGESESGESESGSSEMERAAEDMQRFADEQSAEEERSALEREVEAMRELVRRMREGNSSEGGTGGSGSETESPGSSEGGSEGTSRMDRFVLRARGESEEGDGEGTPIGVPGGGDSGGERGEGEAEGSEGEGGEGERSAAAPGAGGEGGEGEGDGAGGSEEMLMLGAGGDARLELPGMGGPGRGEEGPGSGEGAPESPGEGHGSGSSGDSTDPTGRGGEHTTVRVAGEEGRGPTRSEVIRTSAARGFASREYRDVYGDYRSHAEEALEDEEIPPGYRFYVERYFQLIRPRDE